MPSVNAEHFIRRLTEYVCNEAPDRPWPDSRITVSHVISRNTSLMAVIWKEIDDRIEDNQLDQAGGEARVVFTLTVCSPILKHVTRMVDYLCSVVPYNQRLLWKEIGAEMPQVGGQAWRLSGYDPALLPEEQELTLTAAAPTVMAERFYPVRMLSCYNEGHNSDYNPTLDIWQGECMFISRMVDERE